MLPQLRRSLQSLYFRNQVKEQGKLLPLKIPQLQRLYMATKSSSQEGSTEVSDGQVKARIMLQQCLSAKLMVQPATDSEVAKYVHIDKGLVIYLCFLKGADEKILDKMVKSIFAARLSENADGGHVSILELPGDVLIIPQATLGGYLRGKSMQYHKNINKEFGLTLYSRFVQLCEETVKNSDKCREKGTCVQHGTYGNRQVFSTDTNGPYTHLLEF